jgi:tetratricopeptide (TPR) repeat protein
MHDLLKWGIGVVLALSPMSARAQTAYPECTTPPTEQDVTAAQGAFEAGKAAFDEADYQRAITYWEDAYRRDCTAHLLLHNLSRAYELSGQKEQAVITLETYLARRPGAPKREQILKRIDVLKRQIEEEKKAPVPTSNQVDSSPAKPVKVAPMPTTPPVVEKQARPITPLILAGAGGLLFVGGGIGWVVQKGKVSNYQEDCPENAAGDRACATEEDKTAANKAQAWRNIWGLTSIAGLGLDVGGVVWYTVVPNQRKTEAIPKITPAVGPGFAGLVMDGHF